MRSFVTQLLFLGGASLVASAPHPVHILKERTGSGGCNADNLLRLLRSSDNIGEAVVFCSGYLNLPGTTVTVATVTPTLTVSETATVTVVDEVEKTITKTITFTDTDTITNTETECVTNTNTATETETAYTTITNQYNQYEKRHSKTPLTDRIATYPPQRISSACSCLTVPLEIIPVTHTAPQVTVTVSDTVTTETTKTVTETAEESTTVAEVTETVTTVTNFKEVDVTTTLTTVVTVYTNPPAPEEFVLRSNGPAVSQHYLKAVAHDNAVDVTHAIFVPNKADATVWFLDSQNRLAYKNGAHSNAVWVSYTVGNANPREILWNTPPGVSGPYLVWKKHANGNVVPDDGSLDKLQSCVPDEAGINGEKTLFIGTFIDNQEGCKSVDLHPEAPL